MSHTNETYTNNKRQRHAPPNFFVDNRPLYFGAKEFIRRIISKHNSRPSKR